MEIKWYIGLAVALFCTGIVGVLTRRNSIIIFMCIELMLNAVNLLLVAFSKMHAASAIGIADPSIVSNQQCTNICILYHGGGSGRSKCGTSHHSNAVA